MVAGPVLTIARSADAVMIVLAVEVLLPGTGSEVVDDTLAVLDSVVAWAGAVTTKVMTGAMTPVARVATVQVTEVLPTLVQVQPVPLAEMKVTPAGRVSV